MIRILSVVIATGYMLPAGISVFGMFIHMHFSTLHMVTISAALLIGCSEMFGSSQLVKTQKSLWAQWMLGTQGVATTFLMLLVASLWIQDPAEAIHMMGAVTAERMNEILAPVGISLEVFLEVVFKIAAAGMALAVVIFQGIILVYYKSVWERLKRNL